MDLFLYYWLFINHTNAAKIISGALKTNCLKKKKHLSCRAEVEISDKPTFWPTDKAEVVISEKPTIWPTDKVEVVISDKQTIWPTDKAKVVISDKPTILRTWTFNY